MSSLAGHDRPLARAAPLWPRFLAFLAPLVLTNVLQALSGTLNNVYLGRMLGTQALAAAVVFFPILMLLISFVIGLGTGGSIVVGQAWGARNLDKVRQAAGTALVGAAGLGLVMAAVGQLCIAPLLAALRTPPDVLEQAVSYARVMLLALPVVFISILAAALLRGIGDTLTSLRSLAITTACSMLLTPVLIRGWLGIAPVGVTSAAWAVLASYVAGVGWLVWHLGRRGHELSWAQLRPHLRLHGPMLSQMVRLGVPSALFFITGSLADIALLSLVNAHGSRATAAWGAVNQVMAYVQFPAMSIAIAASVFTAQAIGGDRLAQVAQVTRVGLAMNLLLTGSLALAAALLAPFATGLFITDPAVVTLASQVLQITVGGSVLFGLASVFTAVMRAAGTVRMPTAISLGCLALLLFPLGWVFDRHLGLRWIWLAYPLTYATALLLQAWYFHRVWKQRPIRKLV